MRVVISIALRHLLSRKRQSVVSLMGIIIGVAFFLAIASLMQGSQTDFIKRLVDESPHVTVTDEYRNVKRQPVFDAYPNELVELRSVKPQTETRGIRGYHQILDYLKTIPGVQASASLSGQAIVNFAGKEQALNLSGMVPSEIAGVTTIDDDMVQGSIEDLIANRNGIILGESFMTKMSVKLNDNITLASSTGQVRTFKIVGVFRTGRADYDETRAFLDIKRVQALMNRSNRANTIIIKMDRPEDARVLASEIESRIGYKAESWQEMSEDIMSTLVIRNIIMYSVVSAVLIVAAFGIYNIISTVVMEKQRDIAILKSMGYRASDIRHIFLVQGALLGLAGLATGLPLGCVLMLVLGQVQLKPPGITEPINIPLDWSFPQFLIAGSFAFFAALFASYLPARKAAGVMPVEILRGGT